MSGFTRRQVIGLVPSIGLVGAATAVTVEGDEEPSADRTAVLSVGMTEAEADCWSLAGRLAGAFFELPDLHPMDDQEVAQAIHVIQNKLLSRPTYRAYLAAHKTEGK